MPPIILKNLNRFLRRAPLVSLVVMQSSLSLYSIGLVNATLNYQNFAGRPKTCSTSLSCDIEHQRVNRNNIPPSCRIRRAPDGKNAAFHRESYQQQWSMMPPVGGVVEEGQQPQQGFGVIRRWRHQQLDSHLYPVGTLNQQEPRLK